MLSDFYESVKVSESEINDTDSSSLTFTCKNTDISEYQEFIDARKAEIGAGDAQ
jgi:GH25 family lysozyme M1 (1,4-beta-N-acetylmuramidase)